MLSIAIGMAIGHAAMYGPQAAFFSELFGTGVRYSGISLGFQLASPFAGGLAPLIATALLSWSGNNPWPVAVYLSSSAALTAISVWWAPETYNADLAGSGPEEGMANSQFAHLESGEKALASLPVSEPENSRGRRRATSTKEEGSNREDRQARRTSAL